jgi:tetratricopeptide (TPR) repeat protein
MGHIFLSYAREDEQQVLNLYSAIQDAGFEPWMDQENILPGQDFELEIRQAIQTASLFIACLSEASVKKRGMVQKEYKLALDVLREFPEHAVYFIPIRFDNCSVPSGMAKLQWVDLFEKDGLEKLLRAISHYLKPQDSVPGLLKARSTPDFKSHQQSVKFTERGREEVREFGKRAVRSQWDWHNLGNALEDYLDAIKYDPEHQHPWTNIAYAYYLIGEFEMAEKCMERSYALAGPGPNHPGRNWKNVRRALDRGVSLSETSIHRPPMPDWFRSKYRDFLDLGAGVEVTFKEIQRYLKLDIGESDEETSAT